MFVHYLGQIVKVKVEARWIFVNALKGEEEKISTFGQEMRNGLLVMVYYSLVSILFGRLRENSKEAF